LNSKIKLIFLLLQLLSFSALAQYGNEWISYSHSYYKIRVADNQIFKLDYNSLKDAGLPVNNINPRTFQIYHNGEEQHIWVEGETDNVFNNSDFLLFYGERNDGTLDQALYRNPGEQPHNFSSLYTDSSAYFLTWGKTNSTRRYKIQSDQNITGLVADSFYMHTVNQWFDNQWFDGTPFSNYGSFSEYTEGEGWMSGDIRSSQSGYWVATPGYARVTGIDIKYNVLGFGKSDPSQPGDFDANGNNHELTVYYDNISNVLGSSRGRGYCTHKIGGAIPSAIFKDNSRMLFSSTFGARQRQVISYFSITYPKLFRDISEPITKIHWTKGNRRIDLNNYSGSSKIPIVWDLTSKNIIPASLVGSNLRFKINANGDNELLIADSSAIIQRIAPEELKAVSFTAFNFSSQPDYLILTDKRLSEGAREYATYRNSAVGGSHRTAVVYVQDLYDQYYYGIHHPLALKNFIRANWDKGGKKLKYLFFLGKGQSYYLCTQNAARRDGLDLVPTMGYPPSDYLFSTGLESSSVTPEIATGRLPVKTNAEIRQYLDKIKSHEVSLNSPEPWKKHVIQLSGGTTKSENAQFKGYLSKYSDIIASDSFGGNTSLFSKDQNVVIQDNLTAAIIKRVNTGATMFNYFGHGSSDVLEINIGIPNQHSNYEKYPLFYFNGCILGNSYDINSLGEKFLLEPNAGAINWLASTNYGFTTVLYDYGRIFHNKFFRDTYGQSIGSTLLSTIKSYIQSSDDFKVTMCHQFTCQGDPAIRYFSPQKPDFTFDQSNTRLNPAVFPSNADSITFEIKVDNLGKTGTDTIGLKFMRTNGSGVTKDYNLRLKAPTGSNTFAFRLENSDTFRGLNLIRLEIDPSNEISEQGPNGESNNIWTTNFFVPSDNVFLSSPLPNEIVNTTQVTLEVRSASGSITPILVQFELDTTSTFNSPIKHSAAVQGTAVFSTTVQLLAKDSLDYYWRARIAGNENAWVNGNFAMIFNAEKGASQSNSDLISRGSFDKMYIDTFSNYQFSSTLSQNYDIHVGGQFGSSRRGLRINGRLARLLWFVNNGVQILAINPRDESRLIIESQFNTTSPRNPLDWGYTEKVNDPYYIYGNKTGVYEFNTTLVEHQDSLLEFLKMVPEDYYLFMYNGVQTGIESWKPELFDAFEAFGFTDLKDNIREGWPFGLKGNRLNPEDAVRVYADSNNTVVLPVEQSYTIPTFLAIPHAEGSFTSELIGPAKSWKQAYYSLKSERVNQDDKFRFDIIAITESAEESLVASTDSKTIDISSIDAGKYPYIKLRIHFKDSLRRNASQLNRWVVSYSPSPDGNLILSKTKIEHDTLNQGDLLVLSSVFENLGSDTFDKSNYQLSIYNSSNTLVKEIRDSFEMINPGQQVANSDSFETTDFSGSLRLLVNYNPDRKPLEPNFLNNSSIHDFYVRPFNSNALADIKVDGRIIMDQELVSSSPDISVHVLQVDSFIFYDDVSYYDLYLKYPGEDSFRVIDLFAPNVEFIPASKIGGSHTLILHEEKLKDGLYEVRSTISNPIKPSQVDQVHARFKVISKMAVSNVYFYPSPFTTQAKVVYTLTGENPPEEFRIDIYTISGRKVKSIDLHLEEDLAIGTHLSNYSWDGTDQYGDRLANGVYLYKTKVRQDGKELDLHEQSNDQLFNQGFGKLYILR